MVKRSIVALVHRAFRFRPFESALTAFTEEREISDLIARLAPGNASYKSPALRCVTRNGVRFRLDISDYQDWLVYWGITTDRPERLYALAKEGDVVFDVGANIGEVSLRLAAIVGARGKVFSFEPDPVSFEKLKVNVSLNRLPNIVLINSGLGEGPGALTMHVESPGNRGANRIASPAPGGNSFTIEIDTIDRMVNEHGVERLDVIKIDVEGFELPVLKGARETLRRFHPTIFLEIDAAHLGRHGVRVGDILDYLHALGYGVRHATSGEMLSDATAGNHCDAICRFSM